MSARPAADLLVQSARPEWCGAIWNERRGGNVDASETYGKRIPEWKRRDDERIYREKRECRGHYRKSEQEHSSSETTF